MSTQLNFDDSTGQICVVSVLAELFKDEDDFEAEYRSLLVRQISLHSVDHPRRGTSRKEKLIYQTHALAPEIQFWPDFDQPNHILEPGAHLGSRPTPTMEQPRVPLVTNHNSTAAKKATRQVPPRMRRVQQSYTPAPRRNTQPNFERQTLNDLNPKLEPPHTNSHTIEMTKALDEVLVTHGDTQLMKELQKHMHGPQVKEDEVESTLK